MKRRSGLSATGAVIVIVHIALAILGAVTLWQWLGGIVVGTLVMVSGLVYLKDRRGPAKPDTRSA